MSVMRKTDILLQWDNEKRSSPGPSVKRFRVPLFGQRGGYILDFLHLFFSDRFLHEVDLSCNSGSDGGGDIGPWLSCWCHCGKSNMPREPAFSTVPTAPDWVILSGARPQHFTNSLAITNLCRIFEVWNLSPVTGNAWPIALFNLQHRYWPDYPIPSLNTSIVISQIHSWKESWTRRKFSKKKRHSLERNS